eukprot:SAG22_NODE_352_length_11827_cov_3.941252_5_plen_215_part_00
MLPCLSWRRGGRLEPTAISKLHFADLSAKFSYHGCDISECRAIYATLPPSFQNDADGSKEQWCAVQDSNLGHSDLCIPSQKVPDLRCGILDHQLHRRRNLREKLMALAERERAGTLMGEEAENPAYLYLRGEQPAAAPPTGRDAGSGGGGSGKGGGSVKGKGKGSGKGGLPPPPPPGADYEPKPGKPGRKKKGAAASAGGMDDVLAAIAARRID